MTTTSVRASSSSLAELRAIAQPPEHSPSITDRVYRLVSIYISVPLARTGATPNGITLAWILLELVAIAALVAGTWSARMAGALLLEFSYLLDFVDGEVARLTERKSRAGEFLDLIGHGLAKTALPLAVGVAAARTSGLPQLLVIGALGALAIAVGDSLRFYAACASGDLASGDLGHTVPHRTGARRRGPGRIAAALFHLSFESPGLYGLTLVAAVVDGFAPLALYWAVGGAVWFVLRASRYCGRLDLASRGSA